MLGIGGKFASAKGMVAVPSIIGLTASQALASLNSAGLKVGQTTTTSGSSSQDGKIASQGISPGTLVDYETQIDYASYRYVAPSGPTLVDIIYGPSCGTVLATGIISQTCVGNNYVTVIGTRTVTEILYVYSDGSSSTSTSFCSSGQQESSVYSQSCAALNAPPPPPPPPANCSACVSSYNYSADDSGCASGRAWFSVCDHAAGCSPASSLSRNCVPISQIPPPAPAAPTCTPSCGSVWSGSCSGTINGSRLYAQRCVASDCSESVSRWSSPC